MSYLDPPRFSFFGRFFTDPSTINNATENYNLRTVYNNEPPSQWNPNSVWWNQDGKAWFRITQATVNSVLDQNGGTTDPVIGATIVSVPMSIPPEGPPPAANGRLVDLDPDLQSRSMIVGLRIELTMPGAGAPALAGTIYPMCIADLWGRVIGGSGGGIMSAGAAYQSVLGDLAWGDTSASPFLSSLRAAAPEMLSFKANVDAYDGTITSETFAQGRIAATIGPWLDGEPLHMLARRRMWAGSDLITTTQRSPMNIAGFQLAGNRLTIDLGNSVPTTATLGGPFKDLGPVRAVIDPNGEKIAIPIYTSPDEYSAQYEKSAGIFDLELDADAAAAIADKPLAIVITLPSATPSVATGRDATNLKEGLIIPEQPSVNAGDMIAIAENSDGIWAGVDFTSLRLQNGAPAWDLTALSGAEITRDAQIPLYATTWGKPADGLTISVNTVQNLYQFQLPDGADWIINNKPMSAVTAPAPVTTQNGKAVLSFTANPLSPEEKNQAEPRRSAVDGQIYTFTHTYAMDTQQAIALLVFEDSPYVAEPTWWQDVQPVLLQYARLYPGMRSIIDISSYATVTNAALGIPQKMLAAMGAALTHPGYMPVTRDLSLLKRDMILRWLKNPVEGTPPQSS